MKKKRPRRTIAVTDVNDVNDAHTPAERGNDARNRDRSVRFAEVTENAPPYARPSPLFAASPPPESPSTWLRRRSLSADVSPEPSLATRATSDGDEDEDARTVTRDTRAEPSSAPVLGARAADQPAEARDSAKIAESRTRETLFAVLERPVPARAAAIAVAGAFAASAAARFAVSVLFKGRFGDAGLDVRALAARWAEVEVAAERLADALAAKRMVSR